LSRPFTSEYILALGSVSFPIWILAPFLESYSIFVRGFGFGIAILLALRLAKLIGFQGLENTPTRVAYVVFNGLAMSVFYAYSDSDIAGLQGSELYGAVFTGAMILTQIVAVFFSFDGSGSQKRV